MGGCSEMTVLGLGSSLLVIIIIIIIIIIMTWPGQADKNFQAKISEKFYPRIKFSEKFYPRTKFF